MVTDIDFEKYHRAILRADLVKVIGKVIQVVGLIIEAQVGGVSVGDICTIRIDKENRDAYSEVVGFRENRVLLMPLGSTSGIAPGAQVTAAGKPLMVKVGKEVLGRVLNGLGEPIDGKGPLLGLVEYPLDADPPDPVKRPRVADILKVGIRALDGMLTVGKGQRIGIFAGSRCGERIIPIGWKQMGSSFMEIFPYLASVSHGPAFFPATQDDPSFGSRVAKNRGRGLMVFRVVSQERRNRAGPSS